MSALRKMMNGRQHLPASVDHLNLATFQAIMNEIFADMDDVVVIYINDLMTFTRTENQAEHDKIVLEVLR